MILLDRNALIADMRQQFGCSLATITQIKGYMGLKENRAIKRLMDGYVHIDTGNRKLYHVKDIASAIEARKRCN